jgi:hypothetical protein
MTATDQIHSQRVVDYANRNYKEEVKSGIDLVKFLMKNESDPRLKQRLAELGDTLNAIHLQQNLKVRGLW